MAAPKGNKFGEVWDLEEAISFGKIMVDYTSSTQCYSMVQVLWGMKGLYKFKGEIYTDLPVYLSDKFEEFRRYKKEAERLIEDRVYMAGLDGKKNVTMAIAYLNTHHEWRENKDVKSAGHAMNQITVNVIDPKK